jgi:membrane dipeptidase
MDEAGNNWLIDSHSDILGIDVVAKRLSGRRRVFEEDWVPEMRQAGIGARVVVIYVDQMFLPEMAVRKALDQVSALYSELEESQSISLCASVSDIMKARENGKIGLVLGMEGAEPLVNDLGLLQVFYKLGLRVLGLTHSRRNFVADGSFLSPRKAGVAGGLTDFGIDVVHKANDLGIVIDVTHLNDESFWDVVENTRSPIIASHSNCRSLCNVPRNLTDEQIKAVAKKGGVIGVTTVPSFVDTDKEKADVHGIIKHIDHMLNLVGPRSVGLGFDFFEYCVKYLSEEERARMSDFLTFLPVNLTKDEDAPTLVKELLKQGYMEADLELILRQNFLRVFGEIWK